jgi:hypothetical protein
MYPLLQPVDPEPLPSNVTLALQGPTAVTEALQAIETFHNNVINVVQTRGSRKML